MKKILISICMFLLLGLAFYGRYQPVSLERIKPMIKQIEVKGEVNDPGIYALKWEGTVEDCIDAAGGLTEEADVDAISLVMQPEPDSVVVIPKKNEEGIERISINTATLQELDTLPGIGPSIAQRIIDYRSVTPFSTIEQIKEVKGIGDKMFEKIKDLICL